MEKRFQKFLDKTFRLIPKSNDLNDLREEMLGNLTDKAEELKNKGLSDDEIYSKCIDSLGDYQETIRHLLKINNLEMLKDTLNKGNLYLLITLLATMSIYFIVSFATNAWSYTWLIFAVVAASGFIYVLARLSNKYFAVKTPIKLSVVNSILTFFITVVVYLGLSFLTGMWTKTWIIFTFLPSLIVANIMVALKVSKRKINIWLVYLLIFFLGLDVFFILSVSVKAIGFGKAWIALIIAVMINLIIGIKEANDKIKK